MVKPLRFEVWIVELNPTIGSEVNKSRPCIVVSPNQANLYLNTVIVVPLTSTLKGYPTRIDCFFDGKAGQLAIDQIRAVDKARLLKKIGSIDTKTCEKLCDTMIETFKM